MVTRFESLQDEWEACVAAVRRAVAAGYKEVGAACYLEGIAHAELFALNAELGDLEVLSQQRLSAASAVKLTA